MPVVFRTRIESHERIAEGTFRFRVAAPEFAGSARPGQFAMVRLADRLDPLLARPLAVYDTSVGPDGPPPRPGRKEDATHVDFVYAVHGKFTRALSQLGTGESLEVWGPLGNGFSPPACDHLVLVAGGIGQTALLALAKERLGVARYGAATEGTHRPSAGRCRRATLAWGCRSGDLFGGVSDFSDAGVDVRLATIDGSRGMKGTVVDLLDALSVAGSDGGAAREAVRIACCGPEGMMAAVSRWADGKAIACEVSLETPMACGIGICFSCVTRVREPGGGWDYRRTCVEGPVFDGQAIEWST